MAQTKKIKRSKFLSYQKQGFLYLVFLLFLFFSQAGEYVIHYLSLSKTQKVLNTYLQEELEEAVLEDPQHNAYRNDVLERVSQVDEIEEVFNAYSASQIAGIDQYRENRFSEQNLRKGELGETFVHTWMDQQNQSGGSYTPAELVNYEGKSFDPRTFFFKETPNAVVPVIMEYAKTAYLTEALSDLKKEALVFERYVIEKLEEAPFTSVFKRQLFLGENFSLEFRPTNPEDSIQFVGISQSSSGLMGAQNLARDGQTVRVSYVPRNWGKYFVHVQTSTQRFYTSFEVVKPRLKFVSQEDLIDIQLGVKQQISVDESLLPKSGVEFKSDFAELKYSDGTLTVRPTSVGEFFVQLFVNGKEVDKVRLSARKPDNLEVYLSNTLGEPCSLEDAHRVQSENTKFQVLSYTAVFHPADGSESKEYRSMSRLLPAELQSWTGEKQGTLVLKDIQLLSSNGTTRVLGQPLIVMSHE